MPDRYADPAFVILRMEPHSLDEKKEPLVDGCHYPMFVSLLDRVCLVVGGGGVGERKIRGLLRCGATVRLVSQELTAWLQRQRDAGALSLVGSEYDESQLDGVDLVFASTNKASLNRRIGEDARLRKLWCNMASEPELGSFVVPSLFRQGPLTVAVSTAGLSPAMARQIRIRLEAQFGAEWGLALQLIGRLRASLQSKGLDSSSNQALFRRLADLPVPGWIVDRQKNEALQKIHDVCRPWLSMTELDQLWDELWKPCCLSPPSLPTASDRSDT